MRTRLHGLILVTPRNCLKSLLKEIKNISTKHVVGAIFVLSKNYQKSLLKETRNISILNVGKAFSNTRKYLRISETNARTI